MKPKLLLPVTLLLCFFNLCGYAFTEFDADSILATVQFETIVILVSFVVIWNFWCGRKFARVLVLVVSVIAVLNLLVVLTHTPLQQTIIIAEAIFGAFLLCWLNTDSVKHFFETSTRQQRPGYRVRLTPNNADLKQSVNEQV